MSPAPSQTALSGPNPTRRASSSHVHSHFPFGSGTDGQGSADTPQKTPSQYVHSHFPFASVDSVTQPTPAKQTPPKTHVHNHLPFGSFVKPKPAQQLQPAQPDPALVSEARKLREKLIEARHEPDLPVKPAGIPVANISTPSTAPPPGDDDLPDPSPLQAKTKSKRSIASLSLSSLMPFSNSSNTAGNSAPDKALEEYRRLKSTPLKHRSQELYAPEAMPAHGTGLRTISQEGIDRPTGSKCFERDSEDEGKVDGNAEGGGST